jgi:hypothetical protein
LSDPPESKLDEQISAPLKKAATKSKLFVKHFSQTPAGYFKEALHQIGQNLVCPYRTEDRTNFSTAPPSRAEACPRK